MDLWSQMSKLAPLTPRAYEAFERAFPRILAMVGDGFALEAPEGGAGEDPQFVTDAQRQFGRTLAAAGRYRLWEVLAGELAGFARCLLSRGYGGEVLDRVLRAWIIALHGAMKHPEVDELKTPLELLLRGRGELLEAARGGAGKATVDERFLEALIAGRAGEALAVLPPAPAVPGGVDGIIAGTFYPALGLIGTLWCENRISVAEEHRATATLRSVVNRFFDALPPASRIDRLVAVTCVPGDEHEIGAEIVSRYLSLRGWDASFIGHSSPRSEILRTLSADRPFAVLLSVSMIAHLPSLEDLAAAIRGALPRARLVAGGAALAAAREVMAGTVDAVADSPARAHEVLKGFRE